MREGSRVGILIVVVRVGHKRLSLARAAREGRSSKNRTRGQSFSIDCLEEPFQFDFYPSIRDERIGVFYVRHFLGNERPGHSLLLNLLLEMLL
jgi:hypothetical protein